MTETALCILCNHHFICIWALSGKAIAFAVAWSYETWTLVPSEGWRYQICVFHCVVTRGRPSTGKIPLFSNSAGRRHDCSSHGATTFYWCLDVLWPAGSLKALVSQLVMDVIKSCHTHFSTGSARSLHEIHQKNIVLISIKQVKKKRLFQRPYHGYGIMVMSVFSALLHFLGFLTTSLTSSGDFLISITVSVVLSGSKYSVCIYSPPLPREGVSSYQVCYW